MERMTKGNKVHLEWAKAYWPQDYEVVDEMKILEEENRKLKDKLMLRLAEIYLLSPTSNQMALYKEWNYSKWYDEVKNQMRKEIKEWK